MTLKLKFQIVIINITIVLFSFSKVSASPETHEKHDQHTEHTDDAHAHEEEGFNAGKYIFEHIGDSYDWHLFSIGEKHVSVPLPVILFSKENGLVSFMSSKLHHGHSSVEKNGYKYEIAHEGKYEGKIVEVNPSGEIIRPYDVSITKNIAALLFSIALILLIFISIARKYQKNPNTAPSGLQSAIEPIIIFVRDEIAKPSIGKKYEKFMPFLLTVFFFIWINNMLGLVPIIPGGANLTGNIAVTAVLAVFTFIITTINGNKNYWNHIVNTPGVPVWLKIPPIMPAIELFGIFTKPFVLMIRLFANITAGHIIALSFLSLIFIFAKTSVPLGLGISPVSVLFLIFMTFLELLVAFIQAFVFTFLSALYFGQAVEEHH